MATTDYNYYSEYENRGTVDGTELGENRFLSLEEVINNYMVLYADEENHGMNNRTKVEAFAKRAIQEYSYDTFRVKTWEYEVIDRATFPMPQDFVELIGINYVDRFGSEFWLRPRANSSNPRSPFQYNETIEWVAGVLYERHTPVSYTPVGESSPRVYYALQEVPMTEEGTPDAATTYWREARTGDNGYIYQTDSNGTATSIIFAEEVSVTKSRFDEQNRIQNIVGGELSDDSYRNRGYGYYGKRFYSDPELTNANPTFYLNESNGVIDLDPTLIGEIINLQYVSDGLSDDPSEIKVHKFSEQGIYESIYYEMIARSSRIPANEKERARRRMIASKRQTKLRLMKISPRDIIQTLRSQAKWIKT